MNTTCGATRTLFDESVSEASSSGDPALRTLLTNQLHREWRRLRRRPGTMRDVLAWRTGTADLDERVTGRLASARHLDDVLALTDQAAGPSGDEILHWLMVVGVTEPLAARIVLQRVLPVVVHQARRWPVHHSAIDPADDAIIAASLAIEAYDRSEQRRYIAPRIVSAALHEAFRKPQRRRSFTIERAVAAPRFEREFSPPHELNGTIAAARLIAAAEAAGVDADLLELTRRLARGESTTSIAADRQCTDRTIRNQRTRAISALRTCLGPGWSDWRDPLTAVEFTRAA
ncbi:MAG: hypothetical protein AAFP84_03880 [Actinomycetota bacterium]